MSEGSVFARAFIRVFGTFAVVLLAYYLMPDPRISQGRVWLYVALATLVLSLLSVWQLKAIGKSANPRVRALQTVALIVPAFVVIYAMIYVQMSIWDPAYFNVPLSKTSALYFSMTIFSTVGFGDIVANQDVSRAVVMIQMATNVLFIGLLLRAVGPFATSVMRNLDERKQE